MNGMMLNISLCLLRRLNSESIAYCHWKNNHNIDKGLLGEDDIDLLVRDTDFEHLRSIIDDLGFEEFYNRHIHFPGIFHYYGLDTASGRFVHLHVHTKIVTGESHIKNYYLPLEEMVFQNTCSHNSGCRIPKPEVDYILFVLRYFIKISCLTGYLLQARRQGYVAAELASIYPETELDTVDQLLERYFPCIPPTFFRAMSGALTNGGGIIGKISLGLTLRQKLKPLRRFNTFQALRARYCQVAYRAWNKLIMKEKKSLVKSGKIIAATGLDASGKSTIIYELQQWLAPYFNVRGFHIGRPKAAIVTLPFRALIRTRKFLTSYHYVEGKDLLAKNHKRNIIYAMRYLVLAYERLHLLKSAERLRARGYFILCDRYPSINFGVMDSPRIGQLPGRPIYNLLGKWEKHLYDAMPVPDSVFNLRVPFELALQRNRERQKMGKETEAQMLKRYSLYSDLAYRAEHYETIDASRDIPAILKEMRAKVWEHI